MFFNYPQPPSACGINCGEFKLFLFLYVSIFFILPKATLGVTSSSPFVHLPFANVVKSFKIQNKYKYKTVFL